MTMKKGNTTAKGGRPPLEVEQGDIDLARKLAESGLPAYAICNALGIAENTLKKLRKKSVELDAAIKGGLASHYAQAEEKIWRGELPPTMYIYWSKTKWRNFYPQEKLPEPEETKINLTNEQALAIRKIYKEG